MITLVFFLAVCLSFGCSENQNEMPWYLNEMNMESAWEIADGSGVTIAFIDSGVCTELYDANSDRIVAPWNVLERSSDVTDENGHGTAMVSAACCSKESGIFGIAPEADIMPVKVTGAYGFVAPESLAQGIYWAVDHGADVVCLSLGSRLYSKSVADSIDYANSRNIIVVAAAGDYAERDLLFPASMPEVIAVASENKDGVLCDFSSYSENKSISIPGEGIQTLSTNEDGKSLIKSSSGTSESCAIMAGIIALGLEINPDASVDLVTDCLNRADRGKIIDVQEFLSLIQDEECGFMIKNVKLANRVILAIVVVLGVACMTIAAIDLASGSTSMLLESAKWILLALMGLALYVRSIVNKESAFTRYLALGLIVMFLVFLVVFLVHHPTREWP